MLPESLIDQIIPPPGFFFAERLEKPMTIGSIIVPDGVRMGSRSAIATITHMGRGLEDSWLKVGDEVFVSHSLGKSISFGQRGERVLWLMSPGQVLLRNDGATPERVDNKGRHPYEDIPSSARYYSEIDDPGQLIDEGDTRALR